MLQNLVQRYEILQLLLVILFFYLFERFSHFKVDRSRGYLWNKIAQMRKKKCFHYTFEINICIDMFKETSSGCVKTCQQYLGYFISFLRNSRVSGNAAHSSHVWDKINGKTKVKKSRH